MSLQVWLTGNNNMNNQGLLDDLTETTTPLYVDGKLGKAMSTGGYKMTAEQTAPVLNNEAISICFWIYINADTGTTSNRVMLFGNGSTGINNNRKFSLFNYPSVNDLHWNWMNDTANTTFTNGVLSGVLPSYQWTHVAVTYQNPNGTIYINGEKVHTFSGVSESSTFAYETQVIYNSSYLKWNDYRIYNHCLSPLEVKQISQGLICHYKLSNEYETGQLNKYSGDIAEGSLPTGTFTKTKLENERGYNYKLSYTGTGSNKWFSMNTGSTFSFTAGKKYFYSCKVRCNSANFGLFFRASRSLNDYVTNCVNVLEKVDGQWHEYVVYQTINETYIRSDTTVTCDPILEFFSQNLSTSGKVYTADFDVKDIQVIESDCYVPFIDNLMSTNTIWDCSGYGNNGTRVGNIAWNGNSARYNGSYKFGSTSYIKTGFSATLDELTCSFWVKPNSSDGAYAIIASNYNNPSSGFWITINCENSGLWFYNGAYVKGNNILTNDIWYHGCFTYNNGIGKWYLNGKLVTTSDISSKGTSLTINNLAIGNSYSGSTWNTQFYGNISDFRLYSKCLSADDVKSLYQVSASIDKLGNLSCYEFVEEE